MTIMRMAAIGLLAAWATSGGAAQADGPPLRGSSTVDAYAYTPPPEQLFYNWSGFYFGGHVAGGWFDQRSTLTTVAIEPSGRSGNDFVGGIQGGYQHQFRELVLGAEVTYSWTGIETSFASAATPGLSLTTRLNDLTTFSGRLGYAYMNWLAYWKAGWATASLDYTAAGVGAGSTSGRGNGWLGGAGLSYAFGPNLIGGIEYDYIHVSAAGATVTPGVTQSGTGIDLQTVMLRLDYKFGR